MGVRVGLRVGVGPWVVKGFEGAMGLRARPGASAGLSVKGSRIKGSEVKGSGVKGSGVKGELGENLRVAGRVGLGGALGGVFGGVLPGAGEACCLA